MKNKKAVCGAILAGCLSLAGMSVFAADAITGGGDFDSAVLVAPGVYEVAALPEDHRDFFYFNLDSGQEAQVSVKFNQAAGSNYGTNVGFNLYDSERRQLRNDFGGTGDTFEFSYLSGLGAPGSKYYLETYNDGIWDGGSYVVTFKTADRYDAESKTDAGGDIAGAMAISPGNHKGYLAGGDSFESGGDDLADFYKFNVSSGQSLNINAVPSLEASILLAIYDTQRKLIDEVSVDNPGQIINLPFTAQKGGEVYLAVACYNEYCGERLASYDLGIGAAVGGGAEIAVPDDGSDVVPPGGDTGTGSGGIGAGGMVGQNGAGEIFYDDDGNAMLSHEQAGGVDMLFGGPGISTAFIIGNLIVLGVILFFSLIFYIYSAVCLQKIAKRTNTAPAWLAWVPIANAFLMLKIAQKPWWWFFLLFVPVINIVAAVIVWMKIAEFTGKESWVGALTLVPVIGIAIPAYLAFSGDSQKKTDGGEPEEKKGPEFIGGSKEADKPAVGYKHPCKYCEQMVSPDAAVCPFCGKEGPLGPDRCPKCHDPIDKKWKACAHCGLNLRIVCPFCGKVTFFGKYCEDCGKKLVVACPVCQFEQPPLGDKCIKCGQPLKGSAQK